jgi:hypothetical protein
MGLADNGGMNQTAADHSPCRPWLLPAVSLLVMPVTLPVRRPQVMPGALCAKQYETISIKSSNRRSTRSMEVLLKQFSRVSVSRAGDYYQVEFDNDSDDLHGDYLLIQRQFEIPDGGRSYFEMPEPDRCGHFRVHAISLSGNCLRLDLGFAPWSRLEVHCSADQMAAVTFRRVLRKLFGRRLTIL